ncbi:flippase [Maricurvus nonylphenolicus]|uniref:flippase n=1 Tax=Maricurvus nonylphenolicus TaxID=1008307 RepID=UPI0036F22C7C
MNICDRFKKKPIARTSLYALIEQIVSVLTSFIVVVVIARGFGAESVGEYNGVMAALALLLGIANFGTQAVIAREVAVRKLLLKRYIESALVIRWFVSLPIALIFACFINRVFFDFVPLTFVILIAIYSFLLGIVNLFYNAYMSLGLFSWFAVYSLASKCLLVFVVILIAEFTTWGVFEVVLSMCVVTLGAILGMYYQVRVLKGYFRTRFSFRLSAYLIKKGVVVSLAGVAEAVTLRIDMVMLLAISGAAITGLYSIAAQIYLAFIMAPVVIIRVFFPVYVRLLAESTIEAGNLFLRYRRGALYFGVIISSITLFLGEEIVLLLFGKEYHEAGKYLSLLSVGILVVVLNRLYMSVLLAYDEREKYLKITVVGAVINVIGNAVLIPLYGAIGAVLMTIVAEALVLALAWINASKRQQYAIPAEL